MKAKISTIFIIIATLVLTTVYSQGKNLLNVQASSFEDVNSEWQFKGENYRISQKRATHGESSLKFFKNEEKTETKRINLINTKPFDEAVKAGRYKVSIKVWLTPMHPSGFTISLGEKNPEAKSKDKRIWVPTRFSFEAVETNKWVTLTAYTIVKKKFEARMFLAVQSGQNLGGPGSFYVDEMSFQKVKK